LLCRTAYAEEQADLAVSECLLAVEDAPQDARNQLWLGRAFGQKASHTNPVSAYKLAGRVREAFERAVQLDPNDIDSVSDLSEFYLSAPGVVGGDAQRATELANSLLSRAPARAHRLLGMLAHKNGDDARAEEEFRLAVAAGHTPEAWSDLALFYAQTHAYDRAKDTVEQALAADTRHGPVEVDAATILITVRRAPDLAERALRNYITSDAQTDEAPVPRARVLLGKLLAKRGDTIGARHEFTEAVALAPEYEQAQKALNSL
jgi:tetratricopeptide (TPR) repeat protein